MRVRDMQAYIEKHYNDFPNFDERAVEEILACLPDQDPRYGSTEGLIDILNEVEYR